ncbi:hypothetical protein LUZ60_015448 [Juncus effusus]|nr:hypothetical protein LUZ60_015448 [Juncus effusus]
MLPNTTASSSLHPFSPSLKQNSSFTFIPPFQSFFLATILASINNHSNTNFQFPHNRMEVFSSTEDENWSMVERNETQLLTNNSPFIIHGFNTYWLMVFAVDKSTQHKISDVFAEAKSAGLNTCRTWAFNDGQWRALQISPYNYDEEVFKGLDFVVSEARRHKIRLILCLCNNWEDYGGKSQYVKWAKELGLDLNSDDDFFCDETIKDYYKSFVKAVLMRVNTITNIAYKDDPTILAWELINEPRCPSDPSGDILQAWIEEMAAHIKCIDPVHLVGVGLEGFYGPSTPELVELNPNEYCGTDGTDFIRNHMVEGIDFASAHIYSDVWLDHSNEEDHLKFVQTWMDSHITHSKDLLNKPIIFSEFGVSLKDERFCSDFRHSFMDTVYETFTQRDEIGGGVIMWQLFPEGADHMDDGYAVVLAKFPGTCDLLASHSKRLCGNM